MNVIFEPGIQIALFAAAVAAGLIVRLTLGLVGQQWARTYSNTVTYLILPAVGLVIVEVISNSIALSLGMIGALSIVRFRHPVKSPLELTVYFLLLTIGVALSTRPWLAALLLAGFVLTIIAVSLFQSRRAQNGSPTFPVSAGVGEQVYYLEVSSRAPLEFLSDSDALIFTQHDVVGGRHDYKLAFTHRTQLDATQAMCAGSSDVTEMSATYP